MKEIYQEKIFSGLLSFLPGIFGLASLGFFVYNQFFGTFEDPFEAWILLGIGLLLLFVGINFAFLTIKVSYTGVSARFGILSHSIPLDNIAGCYQDQSSSLSYGGFGIRFGWVKGKRRLVYNITNAPRVVIQEKRDSNHEFVFSTRQPEAVMKAIKDVSRIRQ
jgi:hypothetical protein